MKLPSIKSQLIIFLSAFALYLSFLDGEMIFLFALAVALVSALAADYLFVYLKEKRFTLSESSAISGLIIGYVLYSEQPWWVFSLAAVLAMASKHLIRFHKKHLFNPAAFGIFALIILLGAQTQWKGTYLWYVLVPAGVYFTVKIRKAELLIGYAVTALVLFGAQALMQKTNLLNIFGYLSYFYVFVMIIEPKTTPIKPGGKLIFGAGTAILIFLLTQAGVRFDVELFSLLVFNLAVPWLNKVTK